MHSTKRQWEKTPTLLSPALGRGHVRSSDVTGMEGLCQTVAKRAKTIK